MRLALGLVGALAQAVTYTAIIVAIYRETVRTTEGNHP